MENNTTVLRSAAFAFEQRSATAVAQVAAFYDEGNTHSAVSTVTSTAAPTTNDSSPLSSSSSSSSSSLSPPTLERLKQLDFKAAQIETDEKLAQELQRKEYRKAEAATERRQQRQPIANAANSLSTDQNISSSWSDWLMGTTTTTINETSPTVATARGARIAEPSSSVFACVAQSISTAINPKTEVVGVDSASLL